MAAPLEWVFKLVDKMSAPAKQIADSLSKTEVATKATEKATAALDKTQAHTATTTKTLDAAQTAATTSATQLGAAQAKVADATAKVASAGGGWWSRMGGFAGGASVAAIGITAIGAAAASAAASMFEAAAGQDKLNRAFSGSLGGQGRAAQGYLRGISGSTELTRAQLEDLSLPLARQGMGPEMLSRLIPAALDIQADGGSAAQAVEIFSKIASTGKIEGEAFKALNLKAETAYMKVGERVGLSNVADVKKAIESGQIRSDAILEGLLSSIAGTGLLGDKAVEAARSPAAALNRFRNIQETVFSALAESPAMPKIAAALDKFTAILTSEKVGNGIAAFFEKVGNALSAIDWDAVGNGLGRVVDALAKLAPVAETALNIATLGSIGDAKYKRIQDEGGVRGAVASVPFLRMFLDADVAGAPSANDFVMRADGSVLNIDSADALVGFKPGGPIDRMFAQSSGSGGGVVVENINISVDGGGAPEEMASRLAASIRPALIAELERMAIEVG